LDLFEIKSCYTQPEFDDGFLTISHYGSTLDQIADSGFFPIVIGSKFSDIATGTSGFSGGGISLLLIMFTNTSPGNFEGIQLWHQRGIVETHFYHVL
jgi:hypothetical protein